MHNYDHLEEIIRIIQQILNYAQSRIDNYDQNVFACIYLVFFTKQIFLPTLLMNSMILLYPLNKTSDRFEFL